MAIQCRTCSQIFKNDEVNGLDSSCPKCGADLQGCLIVADDEPTAPPGELSREPGVENWVFRGACLLLLFSFCLSLVGAVELAESLVANPPSPYQHVFISLVVFGIMCGAAGTLVVASLDQFRVGSINVIFAMGFGFNWVGERMRRPNHGALQAGLIVCGTCLLALSGFWLSEIHQQNLPARSWQGGCWGPLAELGAIALALAAVPVIAPPIREQVSDDTDTEA